jgi:eukaryotic-like serine/threonine-protein kinase
VKAALPTDDTRTMLMPALGTDPTDLTVTQQSELATSDAQVPRFVEEGKRANFTGETETLLRGRLKAAAIDLTIVLGIGYIGNMLAGNSQWIVLRTIIFALVIACYVVLRRKWTIRMRWLRAIEIVLFGGVAVQMALMMYSRTAVFAAKEDPTSLVSVQQFFFTAFCLHVLTYGIFVPNTWKRAAIVMTAMALVPYGIYYLQINLDPKVAKLVAENHAVGSIPTTLIAAMIGTFGSHIINRTRKEAFKAKQILQYRLHEVIGSGGMGDVYRAEHVLLKRRCAMKIIKPDKGRNAAMLHRFEREVIATARLSHWNTIDIYDYGHTDDGTFYYVMELLEGENLHALVAKYGPLPPGRVVYLLAQACDALQEAHDAHLIHRDIKPANIFASKRGGVWDVTKLLDFGLVKEKSFEEEAPSEKPSGFSGTPMYMAPEQATQYEHVDGRTDIYALGAVAYFLLTGRPPFQGETVAELIIAHSAQIPTSPSAFAKVPPDLDTVVLRCLKKLPAERFSNARDMAAALRSCSCASEWNEEKARQWWNSLGPVTDQA